MSWEEHDDYNNKNKTENKNDENDKNEDEDDDMDGSSVKKLSDLSRFSSNSPKINRNNKQRMKKKKLQLRPNEKFTRKIKLGNRDNSGQSRIIMYVDENDPERESNTPPPIKRTRHNNQGPLSFMSNAPRFTTNSASNPTNPTNPIVTAVKFTTLSGLYFFIYIYIYIY